MDTTPSKKTIEQFVSRFGGDTQAAIDAIRSLANPSKDPRLSPIPDTPVIVQCSDLVKTYRVGHQEVSALSGVSLQVHKGEFIAITGSSGSGKSTLLQLLGGLEKPSSGTVVVNGTDLATLSDSKLSKFRGETLGFVFQFFYLQPFLDIEHNLEVPGMFRHIKREERCQRVLELAEIVGLTDRLKHMPKELSGGQIQRAAIVRALMNKPSLLLADEPTGNLDSKNSAAIIDLFEDIRSKFGVTIIIATHDPNIARRASRVFALKDGAII